MTGYNPSILGDFSELFPKNSGRLVRDMTYQWSQAGDFNHWAMSLLGWWCHPLAGADFEEPLFQFLLLKETMGIFLIHVRGGGGWKGRINSLSARQDMRAMCVPPARGSPAHVLKNFCNGSVVPMTYSCWIYAPASGKWRFIGIPY